MTTPMDSRQKALKWIREMKKAHEPLCGSVPVYDTIEAALSETPSIRDEARADLAPLVEPHHKKLYQDVFNWCQETGKLPLESEMSELIDIIRADLAPLVEPISGLAGAIDHIDRLESEIRTKGTCKEYTMRIPAQEGDSDFLFDKVLEAARKYLALQMKEK